MVYRVVRDCDRAQSGYGGHRLRVSEDRLGRMLVEAQVCTACAPGDAAGLADSIRQRGWGSVGFAVSLA